MSAKEGGEHFPPFFRQRYGSDPPIRGALYTADEPLLIQSIDRHADRTWIEIHLWADSVHWHRTFVQQYFEDPKIRLSQPLRAHCGAKIATDRLPRFQHDQPGMKGVRGLFAVFHKIVNPVIILDIIYIDIDRNDIDETNFIGR